MDVDVGLDPILKQYENVRGQISDRLGSLERSLALGIAALAAVTAFVNADVDHVTLLLLPMSITAAYLYGCQQLLEVVLLGGYAKFLERQLNAAASHPVWLWETGLVHGIHRSRNGYVLGALYLGVVAASFYVWVDASRSEPSWLVITAGLVILVLVANAQIEIRHAAKRSYADALGLYEERISVQEKRDVNQKDQ